MSATDEILPRERSMRLAGVAGLVAFLGALAVSPLAAAQSFEFRAEGAVALYVDEPHSSRFGAGGYLALRPGISLWRFVTLQGTYAALMTPGSEEGVDAGAAHFLMAGLHLRPFASLGSDSDRLGGFFADANLGYVRTGGLDRFGFDAGLGYAFQVGTWFALGPVVRYAQIVQPDDNAGQNSNDAQLVTLGLELAFGPARRPDVGLVCPPAPEPPPPAPAVAAPICPCSDYDKDGVCDEVDRCPTQAGPSATAGCPINVCAGEPLVVLVQFDYKSSRMPADDG